MQHWDRQSSNGVSSFTSWSQITAVIYSASFCFNWINSWKNIFYEKKNCFLLKNSVNITKCFCHLFSVCLILNRIKHEPKIFRRMNKCYIAICGEQQKPSSEFIHFALMDRNKFFPCSCPHYWETLSWQDQSLPTILVNAQIFQNSFAFPVHKIPCHHVI